MIDLLDYVLCRKIVHPGRLILSESGVTTKVSYRPARWVIPALLTALIVMVYSSAWAYPIAHSLTGNGPLRLGVHVAVMLVSAIAVYLALARVIRNDARGPGTHRQVWCPRELRPVVRQALTTMRAMGDTYDKDRYVHEFEHLLAEVRADVEATTDERCGHEEYRREVLYSAMERIEDHTATAAWVSSRTTTLDKE